VIIDLNARIVLAHSEKESATPTWKRTFGFRPLLAFVDHVPGGTGEPVAGLLRTGRATAINAADHISVLTDALAQLPTEQRARVLVRGDSGAGVHVFVRHIHDLGLQYSVGIYAHQPVLDALATLPRQSWKAALDADGRPRTGAQVAELTRHIGPARLPWPPGMRVSPAANGRTRAPSYASPTPTAASHLLRHESPWRPDRRPGNDRTWSGGGAGATEGWSKCQHGRSTRTSRVSGPCGWCSRCGSGPTSARGRCPASASSWASNQAASQLGEPGKDQLRAADWHVDR
jgi:hypothetical protein